jgi:hypothetical protein
VEGGAPSTPRALHVSPSAALVAQLVAALGEAVREEQQHWEKLETWTQGLGGPHAAAPAARGAGGGAGGAAAAAARETTVQWLRRGVQTAWCVLGVWCAHLVATCSTYVTRAHKELLWGCFSPPIRHARV